MIARDERAGLFFRGAWGYLCPLAEHIAKFRLVERLAVGGMGELYRAKAPGPGGFERDVALKVVREELAASPMFKAMFLEEGKIASLLQHANIIHVNDFGEDEGRFYLCMELVEGCNVGELVEQCRGGRDMLAPRFAAYVAEQVAHGLEYAHNLEVEGTRQQLVHRDVSPGNVLLGYQGAVKLTDFGVARIRREKSLTVAGVRKGTLAYMAPEQLQSLADPRSDVFSLGAVLWEMLVGHPLFEGRTDEQLAEAIRERPIPAPSTYAPDVPAALDAVVLTALERHPRARYQAARDFALALADLALPPRVDAVELGRELRRRFPAGTHRADPPPVRPLDKLGANGRPGEYGATDPDIPLAREPATMVTEPEAAYGIEPVTAPGFGRPEVTAELDRGPPPDLRQAQEARATGSRPHSLSRSVAIGLSAAAVAVFLAVRPSGAEPPRPAATPPPVAPVVPPAQVVAPPPLTPEAPAPVAATPPPQAKPVERSPPPAPKAKARPRPTPPQKPGSLYVIGCHPWVEVVIDGAHQNLYTPLPAHPIPAGKHDIELVNPEVGFDRHLAITVPEGGTIYLRGDPRTLVPSTTDPRDTSKSVEPPPGP